MTWGLACAKFYGFGTYTTYVGGTGYNAPSGSNAFVLTNSNTQVVTVLGSSSSSFTDAVIVTQLASGMQQSINAATAPTSTSAVLNGGNAFDLIITPQSGSAITLHLPANTTLQSLQTYITQNTAGYTVSISNATYTPSGGSPVNTQVLTLTGPTGLGNNFTITMQQLALDPTAVTELNFSPPSAVTVTLPDNSTQTITPLGSVSQNAIFSINGTTYNTTSNTYTLGSLTLNLVGAGTANLASSGAGGSVPNGANGNVGAVGQVINNNVSAATINITGANSIGFNYSSTGGQAGTAQIGGTGGTGGTGGVGGTCGDGASAFDYTHDGAYVSNGGSGNTGGQGGAGGNGGAVAVANSGSIQTQGSYSDALRRLAQVA